MNRRDLPSDWRATNLYRGGEGGVWWSGVHAAALRRRRRFADVGADPGGARRRERRNGWSCVMLRGAVDVLNVVVPYGDQAYYDSRPTIAIAKPGAR